MVTLRETNPSSNCARFAISTAADIADLPTMTSSGTAGNGVELAPVSAGSSAITTSGELKLFMLDGETNEWKERS